MMSRAFFAVSVVLASLSSIQRSQASERVLLTATRIYVAPDEPPLVNGWVLVSDGKIEAVGDAAIPRPEGARIDTACSQGVLVAGFQNSHVHFVDSAFDGAATRPAAELERSLGLMLTRYGFTTVVDTGSLVDNTAALRQRIERGDLKGPAILTAGAPLYPKNGIPIYLRDLPPAVLSQLPQPATPADAVAVVRRNFALGANGTKLFVATPRGQGEIARVSPEIARAAVTETHARGGLVMAHPTDPEGVAAAVAAGVDIVAHTTIDGRSTSWSADLLRDLRTHGVSLVPTLSLWPYELDKAKVPAHVQKTLVADAERQLAAFVAAGGQVLFGTDIGYMSRFDTTEEFVLMAQAGLTPMQILASLTTAPAARWKAAGRRGRVRPGLDADLVVLGGDPAADVRRFADVRCTLRAGRELFVRE